jgi:acetyltransferase
MNKPQSGEYPSEYVEQVHLLDGTLVTIRPIRPDDAAGLQAGFQRLSPESVYLRFLETFSMLTDKQARDFANVDYRNKMALVAEIRENDQDNLIGVARYALVGGHGSKLAESAVVVVDEYQGRGLGTLLLDRLVKYARDHGVETFLGTIHFSNAKIMRFVRRSGFLADKQMLEPGVWEVRVKLESPEEPS